MSADSGPGGFFPAQYPYPPPPPPPGYGFPLAYAGLIQRIGAVLIDMLILVVAAIVLSIPFGILVALSWAGFGSAGLVAAWLWGPFALVTLLLGLAYFTYFEGTTGQTIGKRVVGIRVVVFGSGRPPDLGKAAVRNLLRIVDWLPAFYFIGFVLALLTARKQRLGDVVADTVVVRS